MSFDRKLAIWGFVLGLFGTAFAIWTYVDTKQLSQITYSITQETIYRPSKALDSSLAINGVSHPTSERVIQNIITLWNGGNVPLKGEDTRKKLTILGDSSVRILSFKTVLTKKMSEIDVFQVTGSERSVEIDWRIFDPGEGIQVAILSTGNSGSIDLSGRLLPGQEIVRFPVRSALKTGAMMMTWIGGAIVAFLFALEIMPRISSLIKSRFVSGAVTAVAILVIACCSVYGGYRLNKSARYYVGDISPIDPYLNYIDVDKKLDYRYVPM